MIDFVKAFQMSPEEKQREKEWETTKGKMTVTDAEKESWQVMNERAALAAKERVKT